MVVYFGAGQILRIIKAVLDGGEHPSIKIIMET